MYGKYGGGVESLVGGWEGGACSDAILAKNQQLDRTPCAASTSTCRRNADISDMHLYPGKPYYERRRQGNNT